MKTASSIVAVATGLLAVASLANAADLPLKTSKNLGSGLIVYSQKMTTAAMQIADMKVWAHRS